jgi:hypothetical protein
MSFTHIKDSMIASAVKAATVPAAVLFWNAFIAALPTAILVLTFVSVIIQIVYTVWKWHKEIKQTRDKHEENTD